MTTHLEQLDAHRDRYVQLSPPDPVTLQHFQRSVADVSLLPKLVLAGADQLPHAPGPPLSLPAALLALAPQFLLTPPSMLMTHQLQVITHQFVLPLCSAMIQTFSSSKEPHTKLFHRC